MKLPEITINERPIPAFDIQHMLANMAKEHMGQSFGELSEDQKQQIYDQAVDLLISRELLFQQALETGIVASDEEINTEMQQVVARFEDPEKFVAALEAAGGDKDSFYRMVRQDISVRHYVEQQLTPGEEDLEAEEVEAFYRQHEGQFVSKPQVHARHILVPAEEGQEDQVKASLQQLKTRAEGGEDFTALAQEHSTCPSKDNGGDLGYFTQDKMVQPFSEAAFALEPGQISEPVQTPFGWHLIQVVDKEQERQLSRDEAEPVAKYHLQQQKQQANLNAHLEQLRQQAQVDIQ